MNRKEMGLKWIAIVAIAAMASGCSGISATGGVSPLSFLLPGLVLDDSPKALPSERPPKAPARMENNS